MVAIGLNRRSYSTLGLVITRMGNHPWALIFNSYSDQLSLALALWVDTMSISENVDQCHIIGICG